MSVHIEAVRENTFGISDMAVETTAFCKEKFHVVSPRNMDALKQHFMRKPRDHNIHLPPPQVNNIQIKSYPKKFTRGSSNWTHKNLCFLIPKSLEQYPLVSAVGFNLLIFTPPQ